MRSLLRSRARGTPRARRRPRPTKKISSSPSRRPVALAITGGIGAGKSEMLRAFARHGAAVISSDEIVHRLLREEPVKEAIVKRFGSEILDADGEIDRGLVADRVFADPDELHWLEQLLHPRVVATYLAWREELGERDEPPAVCVTEVPLLYEVGGEDRFDAVVAVTAAPEVRASRRVTPMLERQGRLLPDSEKLDRADYRYVNDGTLEDLDAFVSDVMSRLAGS